MAKTYPDELAEWIKAKAPTMPRKNKHAMAFLAVRADVVAALDSGYPMKTIWEHMRETGRVQCRYETFTLHVKRYIKAPPMHAASPPAASPSPAPAPAQTKPAESKQPAKAAKGIGKFDFNAEPDKGRLI